MTTQVMLSPALLARWTRCLREGMNWSQEALAEAAGLDARTIQRIEAGQPTNVSTRRSLAKGLGYEDPRTFENPEVTTRIIEFLKKIDSLKKDSFKEQYPDCAPVSVLRATSGAKLAALASASANYFHYDDELRACAKQKAASLFDTIRDWGDGYEDISFADRLRFEQDLDAALAELEQDGAWAYTGFRKTAFVGDNWADKTPIPMTIACLVFVPKGKAIDSIALPLRSS